MSFATQELIECAQRELATRRSYPAGWAAGTQKEIEMMETIVGLLGNMESVMETSQILAKRLLAIQQVADSRDTAVQKEFQIAKILNPKL